MVVAWAVCARIRGASADAPEIEIARGHSTRALQLYQASRFKEAAAEFELARMELPLPEIDYDLGRCYEATGDVDASLAAYGRFVAKAPPGDVRDDVLRRMKLLEAASPMVHQRLEQERRRESWRRRWPPLRTAAIATGALALGAGIAAAALYPSLLRDRDQLAEVCPPSCGGSYRRALALDHATLPLFGLAIGAAAIDVALWGVAITARRRAR
jgi:tetratricopeptide (TPR) repeat protein